MSYCHYWGRPVELASEPFRIFAEECKRLRKALGVPTLGLFGGVKIGGATGWGRPIFSTDMICFNGRPPMETLLIRRVFPHPERDTGDFNLHWDFVKTNQAPYDELVVAILLSFKHCFPQTALYSDGGKAEWAPGIALYERTTNRTVPDFTVLAAPQAEDGR